MTIKEYNKQLFEIEQEQNKIWKKRCQLIEKYKSEQEQNAPHYRVLKEFPWMPAGFVFWFDDNNNMRDVNGVDIDISPYISIKHYFKEEFDGDRAFYADGIWIEEITPKEGQNE